jgi:hypothetical protein
MNQHQRKFLLEQIESIYKAERQSLLQRKPVAPSLNNYLIAAILDGTAKMHPAEKIKEYIRKRVRDLGKGAALTTPEDRWGSRNQDDKREETINLPALALYEMPAAFAEVHSAYEAAQKAWDEESKALEASINAMRIKVQVGSDKALEALVEQADNICRMSLTASSRLLLSSPTG